MSRVAAIRFPVGWDPAWVEGPSRQVRQQVYFEQLAGVYRAHVRPPVPGMQDCVFVTGHPLDTMLYPTGHPKAQQPRYRWEPSPDGCEHGYLLEDDA